MARPRILPEFNPYIPTIIMKDYPSLVPQIEEAIEASINKVVNWDLTWCNITAKFRSRLFRSAMVMGSRAVTAEERAALDWLRHKGKWQWETDRKPKRISRSSATTKADSRKAGT